MSRMPRYSTYAERLAAYRPQQDDTGPNLYMPALAPLWTVPTKGRWRLAVDLAARLLQAVSEEMQAYSDQRSEAWNMGQTADRLHENIDQVAEALQRVDDLRSEF